MKKKTRVIIIILVVLACAAGAFVFIKKKTSASAKVGDNIYRASKETYESIIEISGTVDAAEQQTLQALGKGTVMAVYKKAGDRVKKGDVIVQLDDSTQVYNLEKHDLNIATSRINSSAREIDLLETERASLVQKVSEQQIVATFDGVIASLNVKVGQSLEAKDSIGTLVNVDYLTCEVEIAETDVAKLQIGQRVEFVFSALKTETVYGYVTGWPAIGSITNRGASVVKASIRIDEYPEEILPNYSFTGKIVLKEPEEYVIVDKYAVGRDEDGTNYVVELRTGEKITVTAVPYSSDYYKVTEGLSGGEMLKEVEQPKSSGWNKNAANRSKSDKNSNDQGFNFGGGGGMPSGGGMPGGGGGGMPF